MEAPPVNRLLQLLRQKPAEPLGPAPPVLSSTSYPGSSPEGLEKSDILYATKSIIQYVTKNEGSLALTDLSKGQQRVLKFLLSNRDTSTPSQTIPVGYDAISTYCILSRSGSRKVVGELCKKGLLARLETKRGETQGSIYLLESSILYTTKSDISSIEKSSTQSVTKDVYCSSSKKQLLQGLILENAFQDLNPRSLLPYLDQFETVEELQNFLDVANACTNATKEGQSKPIHNPHGFLIAQLRAGYINPPEGYKSRKVRAQELKNQQLEEELATLRRLKEREQELQFELFVAQLTEEDLTHLDHQAQAQVKHNRVVPF